MQLHLRHSRGTAGLVDMALLGDSIDIFQQGLQRRLICTAHYAQAKSPDPGSEERAVAGGFAQIVAQPPLTHLGHLVQQRLQRQGMLAIDQQVMHQQFFDKGRQLNRQLGEEHPEVFQHALARQRLPGALNLHATAVNNVELAVMLQQVVQVQIGLPQTLTVHLRNTGQRAGQHSLLLSTQQGLVFHGTPGIPQTLGALQVFEQQPAALTVTQAVDQQLRRIQALLRELAGTVQFSLKMPRRLVADQQLGQHRTPLPLSQRHIALARQYAQQLLQLQIAPRQLQKLR